MSNTTVYPYGTDGSLPSSIGIINDFTTGGADKALAAEAGKTLYADLYGGDISQTKSDATVVRVLSGVESPDGNRIRVLLNVRAGASVSASCSEGKGVAASIYASYSQALSADTDYLQTISYTFAPSLSGIVAYDGILCVSLAKVGDTAFSDSDMEDYLSALSLSVQKTIIGDINEIDDRIKEVETGSETREPLFLGTLLQKSLTASGLSDTNKERRVSMASNTVLPREKGTLNFVLPEGYAVGIRSGNEAGNLSYNNFWYFNGDTFTFASDVHYFRLCFAKGATNGGTDTTVEVSLAEVEQLLSEGKISIFLSGEASIIERNYENENYVKAVMRNFVSGITNNGSLTKLPIFAHISDVHGDATRFRSFADYCDYLGVDAALVSGDCVASTPADSMQYVNDLADSHDTPILICMGNHDAYGLSTAQGQNEQIMGYLIEKNESVTPVLETYPTYFYHDFPTKKIRVISINLYESSHTSHNCHFSSAQCEWFISALANTPQDYGVIVMFHSPEAMPSKDSGHEDFYQDIVNYDSLQTGNSGNPFKTIIDAFIGKSTISVEYTSNGTNITASANFSNLNSGVEFIAYVNGHLHVDRIGYIPGTAHKQLNLNVCCGVAIYGTTYQGLANLSDLPRGCSGATQDSFNIYAIDRAAKSVRIAKVGSNITGDLAERKYMVIPYAD